MRIARIKRKFLVHGQQRSLHILAGHHERNVGFRRALGDGDYIYIFAAQHAEGAPGHADGAAHIFADDGNDGDVGIEVMCSTF